MSRNVVFCEIIRQKTVRDQLWPSGAFIFLTFSFILIFHFYLIFLFF